MNNWQFSHCFHELQQNVSAFCVTCRADPLAYILYSWWCWSLLHVLIRCRHSSLKLYYVIIGSIHQDSQLWFTGYKTTSRFLFLHFYQFPNFWEPLPHGHPRVSSHMHSLFCWLSPGHHPCALLNRSEAQKDWLQPQGNYFCSVRCLTEWLTLLNLSDQPFHTALCTIIVWTPHNLWVIQLCMHLAHYALLLHMHYDPENRPIKVSIAFGIWDKKKRSICNQP